MPLCPKLWDNPEVLRVTSGVKVNPEATARGRIPILQRLPDWPSSSGPSSTLPVWAFTGLGGRGMIHHGILGEKLAADVITALAEGARGPQEDETTDLLA